MLHGAMYMRQTLTVFYHTAVKSRYNILFFCLRNSVRDKIVAIFQATFSNAFSLIKIVIFWWKFHWNFFQGSNQNNSIMGSDNGFALTRRQAIIWTNDGYFTDTYASLVFNELRIFEDGVWGVYCDFKIWHVIYCSHSCVHCMQYCCGEIILQYQCFIWNQSVQFIQHFIQQFTRRKFYVSESTPPFC